MSRYGSRNVLVVFVFSFLAGGLSFAQTQMASLHSGNGLVWQRTSPTAQKPDGPVLYQLLFSTAGITNQIAKFDSNPRHLTNSLLSDNGSIHVGTGNTFAIASDGIITFAAGQTFPGGGGGTVTSVGLSAPADFTVGSAVTSSGNLSFNWVVAPTNANTSSAIVKRDANGDFTAHTVTLQANLVIPETAFSGAVGVITMGSVRFAHAAGASNDTFLGEFAGNFSMSGNNNTGIGTASLQSDSSGSNNTAIGSNALFDDNTGSGNTAVGSLAGRTGTPANTNLSGSNNTFIGFQAGPGTTTQLTNATAIGANAVVSANNSVVLGNGANVGIGTPTPGAKLDVVGTVRVGGGTPISAIQAGTATIGPNPVAAAEGQFTITFPSTFASTPHVIVTARGVDANDVFAVSTRSITTTQFVVNVVRLDSGASAGWGQNLQLDWFAWQ